MVCLSNYFILSRVPSLYCKWNMKQWSLVAVTVSGRAIYLVVYVQTSSFTANHWPRNFTSQLLLPGGHTLLTTWQWQVTIRSMWTLTDCSWVRPRWQHSGLVSAPSSWVRIPGLRIRSAPRLYQCNTVIWHAQAICCLRENIRVKKQRKTTCWLLSAPF